MALGSTQPLTEMSTRLFPVIRNIPGGKGGRCIWLTTYHHYSAVVTKTRSLNSPGPLRAYMACWGRLYLYIITINSMIFIKRYYQRGFVVYDGGCFGLKAKSVAELKQNRNCIIRCFLAKSALTQCI